MLAGIRAAADRRYATSVPAAPLGDVAGRYLLRDDYPIDVAVTGGQLTFSTAAQPPVVLLAAPEGWHRHPGLGLEIRFVQTDEQPYILELRQEGVTQVVRCATSRM